MNELRTVDFTNSSFECGGKTWIISKTLSFERYKKLQEYILEFGFSATFSDIFKQVRKAWDYLNGLKLAEGAVVLHNVLSGISKLETKYDVSFRIAALFINTEGEDLADASDEHIASKIEVWSKELDAIPFFHFAASLSREWIAAYNISTLDTFAETQKKENSTKPNK